MIVISTILIADKSEAFAQVLADELCQRHKIHICHNGVTALKLLNEVRPDALILDLCLTHMTGIDVLKISAYQPAVIFGITNIVTDSVVDAATAAGIKQLFLKPCNAKVVASRLLDMLSLEKQEKTAP